MKTKTNEKKDKQNQLLSSPKCGINRKRSCNKQKRRINNEFHF